MLGQPQTLFLCTYDIEIILLWKKFLMMKVDLDSLPVTGPYPLLYGLLSRWFSGWNPFGGIGNSSFHQGQLLGYKIPSSQSTLFFEDFVTGGGSAPMGHLVEIHKLFLGKDGKNVGWQQTCGLATCRIFFSKNGCNLGVSPTHDASEMIICSFLWRAPEINLFELHC